MLWVSGLELRRKSAIRAHTVHCHRISRIFDSTGTFLGIRTGLASCCAFIAARDLVIGPSTEWGSPASEVDAVLAVALRWRPAC